MTERDRAGASSFGDAREVTVDIDDEVESSGAVPRTWAPDDRDVIRIHPERATGRLLRPADADIDRRALSDARRRPSTGPAHLGRRDVCLCRPVARRRMIDAGRCCTMDRLSPLDSLFLHVEDGVTHMHIGSCAIFEGPPPPYQDFTDLVAAAAAPASLPSTRTVRARSARAAGVGRRPALHLAYHVRHSALPPPGGEEELCNLMGRLMAVELDRHRPLWEVWMIEGLAGTRWALISKVHHCMVDGISGTDLMVQLLDAGRRHRKPKPEEWVPSTGAVRSRTRRQGDRRLAIRADGAVTAPPGRCCAAREALLPRWATRWMGPWRWVGACSLHHLRCRSKEPSDHTVAGPSHEPASMN